MNEQPKKRPWFLIHLSTAVILMFVAGGLIWANIRVSDLEYEITGFNYNAHGWPCRAFFWLILEPDLEGRNLVTEYSYQMLAIDIGIALAILFAVWFVCEWWIRWRFARLSRP